MAENQTTDPRIDAVARVLFVRHYVNRDDASMEWATKYWDDCHDLAHVGDCPHAERQGPITCDRCVCDEFRDDARAVLEVVSDGH